MRRIVRLVAPWVTLATLASWLLPVVTEGKLSTNHNETLVRHR